MTNDTRRWRCTICGYIHDEEKPPYRCPICGASAELFKEITRSQLPT